jgi:hypothetical protein
VQAEAIGFAMVLLKLCTKLKTENLHEQMKMQASNWPVEPPTVARGGRLGA